MVGGSHIPPSPPPPPPRQGPVLEPKLARGMDGQEAGPAPGLSWGQLPPHPSLKFEAFGALEDHSELT